MVVAAILLVALAGSLIAAMVYLAIDSQRPSSAAAAARARHETEEEWRARRRAEAAAETARREAERARIEALERFDLEPRRDLADVAFIASGAPPRDPAEAPARLLASSAVSVLERCAVCGRRVTGTDHVEEAGRKRHRDCLS